MSAIHADLSEARRLLGAGMKLVEMVPYTKRPIGLEWNKHAATSINATATGYGLILADNKLCSLDPDDAEKARLGLQALGFSLDELMAAGVRTGSTRKGSGGRSTFAAECDLSWLKFATGTKEIIVEFRADSPNLQDCVPGIVYRDKYGNVCTQQYVNGKRLDDAPALPDSLYRWWSRCSNDIDFLHEQQRIFFAAIGQAPRLANSTGSGHKITLAHAAPGYRGAFNRAHNVEQLLEQHDYIYDRRSKRWTYSGAGGAPGIYPVPGKDGLWRSDHGGDPLSGAFDAWTAFVVLDHDGDLEAAKRACRESGIYVTPNVDPPDIELPPLEAYADDAGGERAHPGNNRDSSGVAFTWARDFPTVTAPKMLVAGLLEAGTLACLFGDSNTGKSTFALDIGLSSSRGGTWRGRRTTKGIVFWLSLESAAGARRRVAAHCIKHKLGAGSLLFADVTTAVQLLQLHDVDQVIAGLKAAEAEAGEKCVLVVVDTLARAMAGGDENTSQDMGLLVKGCDKVRAETGATVLLIHHSGKDSTKGARGSGSLRAAVDTEIEVTGQANPRQAKVTKQRDLPTGDAFAFDLEPVEIGFDDETGEAFTACVVAHRDDVPQAAIVPKGKAVASILRALRSQQDAHSKTGKHGPLIWTLEDMRLIGRNLGQHRNTAREAVDRLVMSGLTVPTIGGHRLTEASE